MTTPSPEFVEQVKQVLEHLYDFAYLQAHPLAQKIAVTKKRESVTIGHHLRRELVESIEALSPSVAMDTPDGRLHTLLQLHYVEAITVREVGQRLSLSTRQVQRSLRRAEESVAAILWARLQQAQPSALHVSSVTQEIAQLETSLQQIDLRHPLQMALNAIQPLMQLRGFELVLSLPEQPLELVTDEAVAQQLFISLLSKVAQEASQSSLELHPLFLTLTHDGQIALETAVSQLVARLGWRMEVGNGRLTLHFQRTKTPTILVVDDNQSLIDLLERYLTGHHCHVITATSGEEGLARAQAMPLSAIILDVMMPGMSGWELLQILRTQPQTAETPIIICSVFNDPTLAEALGATHFLPKPIRRDQILDTLRQLDIV